MPERFLDNELRMELNLVPLSGAQVFSLYIWVLQCTFKVQEILTELREDA